jgi:AAA15 family ATPase/GTPase
MLLRFRFANFRSFRDEQELSLVAGPFTDHPGVVRPSAVISEGILPGAAIYGSNASGKTNVIQAFRFMAEAVSSSHRSWNPEGPIPRDPFMSGQESSGEPSEIEADFVLADVRYRYGFRVDSEVVLEEWLYVYPKGKKQTWFHRRQGSPIAFSNKMAGENRTIENLTRKNSLFLSTAAQNNHESILPVYKWLSSLLFVIGDRGILLHHTSKLCAAPEYRSKVANLISFADLGIADLQLAETEGPVLSKELLAAISSVLKQDLKPPETETELRLIHRFGQKEVPLLLSQESAGTIAYLSLLGPVVDALNKGVPLLIDELDESLHPLLAIELIRMFNTPSSNPKGAQLIFNTHDTNLLSSGVLRRDQIWFTEKDKNANSHLFPLSDFKPRRQENLENGYLQGRYGAIPFINPEVLLTQHEADNGEAG